jgi:hypothetical protein
VLSKSQEVRAHPEHLVGQAFQYARADAMAVTTIADHGAAAKGRLAGGQGPGGAHTAS